MFKKHNRGRPLNGKCFLRVRENLLLFFGADWPNNKPIHHIIFLNKTTFCPAAKNRGVSEALYNCVFELFLWGRLGGRFGRAWNIPYILFLKIHAESVPHSFHVMQDFLIQCRVLKTPMSLNFKSERKKKAFLNGKMNKIWKPSRDFLRVEGEKKKTTRVPGKFESPKLSLS